MVVLVTGDGSFAFGAGSCDDSMAELVLGVVPFVGAGNDCLTKFFRGCDGCVASKVADVCFAVVTFAGVGCL